MTGSSSRNDNDQKRAEEARRVLARVETESETIGTSSLARIAEKASNHMSAQDAQGLDQAEIWGRRVGRGLAVVAFAILAVWLFNWLTR